MKKALFSLFLVFLLTLPLSATKIHIGWNLLGTGDNALNLQSTFSSYSDISWVWVYNNTTQKWEVYGNTQTEKDLIDPTSTLYSETSTVPANSGYWLWNNGEAVDITIPLTPSSSSSQLETGWNLLSSSDKSVDFEKTFSSNSDISIIWTFDNYTQSWGAYGNIEEIRDLIALNRQRRVGSIDDGLAYWVLNSGSTSTISAVEYSNIIEVNSSTLWRGDTTCSTGGKLVTTSTYVDGILTDEVNATFCGLSETQTLVRNDGSCDIFSNVALYSDGEVAYEYKSLHCSCVTCQMEETTLDVNDSNCSYGGDRVESASSIDIQCLSYEEYIISNNLQEYVVEANRTLSSGESGCQFGGVEITTTKKIGDGSSTDKTVSKDTDIICKSSEVYALETGSQSVLLESSITTHEENSTECQYGGLTTHFTKKIGDVVLSEWDVKSCNNYREFTRLQNLGDIFESNVTLVSGDASCPFGGMKRVFTQKVGLDKDGNDINRVWEQLYCNAEVKIKTVELEGNISFTLDEDVEAGESGENYQVLESQDLPSAIVTLEKNGSIEDIIDEITDEISNGSGATVSKVTTQPSKTCLSSVTTELTILNPQQTSSNLILKDILKVILGEDVTVESGFSTLATFFKARITLTETDDSLFASVSVVDDALSDQLSASMKNITSCNNFIDEEYEVISNSQTHAIDSENGSESGNSSSKFANFLFVIDDSGSMDDDIDAVKQAISDFGDAVTNAHLNFRAGVISTADGIETKYGHANRVLYNTGVIENNISLLEEKVVLQTCGTGYTWIETGIYNAEYSLSEGGFAREEMGISDSSPVSIIIVSDEPSQYTSRNYSSSFDPENNIFLDNNWTVYSILREDSCYTYSWGYTYCSDNSGQYDDLSVATGGLVANIRNEDANGNLDFSDIMSEIAKQSSSNAIGFALQKEKVIIPSITVSIDRAGTVVSEAIANSEIDGWMYVESSNSVLFMGESAPKDGDTVVITYSYVEKVEIPTN
jgi:hypothetical protein